MSGPGTELTAGPLRLAIGLVTIEARSPVEARRLADALPAALERALQGGPLRRPTQADRVAGEIVAAAAAQRRAVRG